MNIVSASHLMGFLLVCYVTVILNPIVYISVESVSVNILFLLQYYWFQIMF